LPVSFLKVKGHLVEQCYKENKGVFFAVWDGKEVKYEDEVQVDELVYIPVTAEEVQKKAILLPTKAEEYGNDNKLDKEIKDFITKWLDIPDDVLQFALWNIKRSWVYDRFHTLNYLRALGDTGVGKTRFLDVLGQIHYKAIATSGATTAAPVFRIIEKWRGTLIMDEADFSKSDEAQDIIKIINMGYEKGKFVMRCDQNDASKISLFDPYCPKIMATRRTFQDKATESRCITQVMKETTRKNIPYNLNDDFFNATQKIRNKLLMWRFRNYNNIDPNKSIDLGLDLEPRVKQIVNSFISLFCDDKKQLEKFKVFIKNYQEELIDERRNSYYGGVVGAIHSLLKRGIGDFTTKDIIEEGSLEIKPRGMSSILKTLGFKKTTMKRVYGDVKRCVPLEIGVVQNLLKRYGYDCNDVTVVTILGVTPEKNKDPPTLPPLTVTTVNNVTTVTDSPQETKVEKPPQNQLKPILSKLDVKYYSRCFKCNNSPIEGCRYEIDGQLICDECAKNYVGS